LDFRNGKTLILSLAFRRQSETFAAEFGEVSDQMSDIRSRVSVATQTLLQNKLSSVSRALWVALALLCVALSVYVLMRAKYSGEDSWHPMRSALEVLQASNSEPLYQKLFFTDHIKFQYPPTALLFFDFLSAIGISSPYALNIMNASLLILFAWAFAMFSAQVFGVVKWSGFRVPVGPIAFLLAVRFYPNNLAYQIGQIQLFLGLLFLLACWSILNEKFVWAGSLVGIAATIKPQFAPLGLLALWRSQWRFFGGLFTVGVIALAVSIALFGWRTHLEYFSVLNFLSKHGEYQHLNQSINGLLVRWLYLGPSLDRDPAGSIPQSAFPPYIELVYVATLVSTIFMLIIPFVIKSRERDRISGLLEFCAASLLFTMASPIAWVHHYNILLPMYVIALRAGLERWSGAGLHIACATLILSFFLVGYPVVPASAPTASSLNLLQSHVLIGALLLLGVLLAELRAPLKTIIG
jgi:Glycosyltransferase family 87